MNVMSGGLYDGSTATMATISVDRVGVVSSTNRTIALAGLTIGAVPLRVTGADTYSLQFNSVNMLGNAYVVHPVLTLCRRQKPTSLSAGRGPGR